MKSALCNTKEFIIGIDATRNKSGGAIAYLKGLITAGDPLAYGIKTVHLWAFSDLINKLPEQQWLVKHEVKLDSKSILLQLFWQYFTLPKKVKYNKCDLIFKTDASSICPFKPVATLSQDMLSFEPGEIQRYGWSLARLRLLLIGWIQKHNLHNSDLAIYLTDYARRTIHKSANFSKSIVIPHGVDSAYRKVVFEQPRNFAPDTAIEFIYVSNTAPYKHQWNVVKAVSLLRQAGYCVRLTLVGGGNGKAQYRLEETVNSCDPNGEFVILKPFSATYELIELYRKSHIVIFASSCENLPITLLEAMALGLPICCSDRGPMPEVLGDNGVYFNPENVSHIKEALLTTINDFGSSLFKSQVIKNRSQRYTWEHCSKSTWAQLAKVAKSSCQD